MQVVEYNSGVVRDITGDELLACFNVPSDIPFASYLALKAAIDMKQLFDYLQWVQSSISHTA